MPKLSQLLKFFGFLGAIYCLYAVKTVLGIDISHKYHAPALFKKPIYATLKYYHSHHQ
ncbi:hypothetical protein PCC8801_2157 [Rippkaea orientalis PCC 8801]|uniref:Uncharacterized protein n=1 Tax=Rippkaea orientalis (strain PCC 8801 / RF-1) TaxID=41431 RepID=B7K039_RIPO1|nr:hypothetical protein [Rippkaea orientalis]ACK66186.1 hypothetical protein PCC8801_2157 [Rippkaea orientalis PCC 8801]